jgi:hypothetical protein
MAGEHWPVRVQILAAIVARAEILRRAPFLHRRDVHAGEMDNKCVGPLGCPLPIRTGLIAVHGLTHTDRFRPFQIAKWIGPLKMPLSLQYLRLKYGV